MSFVLVVSDYDDAIAEVVRTYAEYIKTLPYASDLAVVNNGLGDEFNRMLVAAVESSSLRCQVLCLHRAADDATALSQAFKATDGEIVVTLPPYIQIEPGDIGPMVEQVAMDELDCVASWRHPRIDSKADAWKSRAFNSLTRRATNSQLHDLNSGLRVIRRDVVRHVELYGDLYRFVPILAARKGYRVGEHQVRHIAERVRRGDYHFGVYLRRLLDLMSLFFLTKFTNKPLRFFGLVGSTLLAVGIVITLTVIAQWFFPGKPLSDRPLMVFGVVFVVLGVQLFSIGLIGELIIFTHAKSLKEYNVERIYGGVESEDADPSSEDTAGCDASDSQCG